MCNDHEGTVNCVEDLAIFVGYFHVIILSCFLDLCFVYGFI